VTPVDGGDEKSSAPTLALWVRLPCERAELRMAMVLGDRSDPRKLQTSLQKAGKEQESGSVGPMPILHDLRFFAHVGDLPAEPAAPSQPAEGR
jgi:hypothetical protein